MKFCRFCGTQLPGRPVKFCPKCGRNIQVQFQNQQATTPQTHKPRQARSKPVRQQRSPSTRNLERVSEQQTYQRPTRERKTASNEVKIPKDQQPILYNQRLKASLERLHDSNKNLDHRENYTLADHNSIVHLLDELVEHKQNHFFDQSDYIEATEQIIEETYDVLIRISEFLTSHLSTFGLDKVRKEWFDLKETQNHLVLDRDRIFELNKISDKLEKNFNILAYRLEDTTSMRMERSNFFAAFPQVHHYFFGAVDKTIPVYLGQIDASGFNLYYKNEISTLKRVHKYFTADQYRIVDPYKVYKRIVRYLEYRDTLKEKLDTKIIEIQRQIITNNDVIKSLRVRYAETMEKVIENTPSDVLLIKEEVDSLIESRVEPIVEAKETQILQKIDELDRLVQRKVEPTSDLTRLSLLQKLDDSKSLGELGKLTELEDPKTLTDFSNLDE